MAIKITNSQDNFYLHKTSILSLYFPSHFKVSSLLDIGYRTEQQGMREIGIHTILFSIYFSYVSMHLNLKHQAQNGDWQ